MLSDATQPSILLRVIGSCDGHTIHDPEMFTEMGLHRDIVEHVTATHRSDGTPKGSLYTNGKPVDSLRGVYGLDMLEFIASALGVTCRQCIGRGFRADAIRQAVRQHLQPESSGQ